MERTMIRRYAVAMILSLAASTSMMRGVSLRAGQTPAPGGGSIIPAVPGQSRTQLPDGRWLVLGGEGAEARGWLWNPATDLTTTFPLQTLRAWHTATVLPDGGVLIAGGRQNAAAVSTAELFDPATQTFSPVAMDAAVPRAEHTATLLIDGRVLVAGGTSGDGAVPPAEIWDLRTHTATALAEASGALGRVRQTAALLADGRVQLSGGRQLDGTPVRDVLIIDPHNLTVMRSDSPIDEVDVPVLAEALPANGAADVPPDTHLALRFSNAMRPESLTSESLILSGPEGVVTTQVILAEGSRLAFIWPASVLTGASTYTLTVSGAVDVRGLPAAPTVISFTTSASSDTTNPVIDSEAWLPDRDAARNGWRANRPPPHRGSPSHRSSPLPA
jgi:hypothetical protein